MYRIEEIKPFGAVLTSARSGRSITELPIDDVEAIVDEHKILLLRGFSLLDSEEFKRFAASFGPMLSWKEFGEILDLRVEDNPANHIFSRGRVEMHWDGA